MASIDREEFSMTNRVRGFTRCGALVVALVALLAGCGSTVQLPASSTAANGGGLAVPTGGPADPLGTAGGGSGTGATGSIAGAGSNGASSGGTVGSAGTSTGSGAGTGGGTGGGTVAPVSGGTIQIGFIYTTGRQQAAAALGAAGVTSGDEEAQWKVLVHYINTHGGVAGRQIQPVYHGESDTSTESISSQEQAACDDFTQDHHVFAAMSSFEVTDTFLGCMQKRGVPTLISLESISDGSEFQRLPLHFEPSDINLDRQATALADGLASEGYLASRTPATKAKFGIFTYNTASYDHAAHALAGRLKQHGAASVEISEAPFANTTSDTSGIATAASSAVLKFRSDGVDHVMFLDLNGLLAFLFMEQAASQGYTPRYGLTSQSSGSHLADLLGNNANSQLNNAVGIGWIPVLDLPATQYPDKAGTAPKQLCVRLMRSGGQSQGLSSPGAELVALGQCDDAFLLQAAAARAGAQLSASTLLAAVDGLRNAYTPTLTFTASFASGQHDGGSSVRKVAYATSCKCFRYTSAPYSIG
jgi:hypothetical protein